MFTFEIKTYNGKNTFEKSHLFILSKGKNAGKPLDQPCPNCFVITCENEEQKELLYWLSYGLWQGKAFEPFLRGSVIMFLTIGEYKKVMRTGIQKANEDQNKFNKAVKALHYIKQQEELQKKQYQVLQEYKKVLFQQYV